MDRFSTFLFASISMLLVGACSTTIVEASPTPTPSPSTTSGEGLPPGDPAAFGTSCTLGGSAPKTTTAADESCALGLCVFDGRRDLVTATGTGYHETYCSADCTKVSCPEGWECVDAGSAGGDRRVCAKALAVCGDGIKQPDEACDDGNRYQFDGCRADCRKVGGPQLSVDELLIDGRKYETYYPTVPAKGTTGEFAEFADITNDSFRVTFAVDGSVPYAKFEMVLPRVKGVVATGPGSPYKLEPGGGMIEPPAQPPSIEILEVGADGRSYRVAFSYSNARKVSCKFVATLP